MIKVLPFPAVESKEVLSRWLKDNGFLVSNVTLGSSSFELKGVSDSQSWEIVLQPRSPLATQIQIRCINNGQADYERIEKLWAFLNSYYVSSKKGKDDLNPFIPSGVLAQAGYCVCISAVTEYDSVEFSGFIIDKEGLVLSTAHDLTGVKSISVKINGNILKKGSLLVKDKYKDLALIKIDINFDSSISLAKRRDIPIVGEKVYFISCPYNHREKVHSGVIIGKPRLADDMPLWPMKIKVFRGDSGSPVFDTEGNLVGIVKGRYRGTDFLGFLIPFDTIAEFIKEIKPG